MTVIDNLFAALTSSSTFDFEQFRYSEFAARLYPVLISIPTILTFLNISPPLYASAALAQLTEAAATNPSAAAQLTAELTAAIAATSDDINLPIIDSIKKILKKIQEDPQIPEDIKNNLNVELTSLEKSIYDFIYSQLTPELQVLQIIRPELQKQLQELQKRLQALKPVLKIELQPLLQIIQPKLQQVLKERLLQLQQQLQQQQQQLQQQLLWRIQSQLQYERFLPLINELITTLNQ